MDEYLRLGLLLLAAGIFSLILLESWHRRRRYKIAEMSMMNYHSLSGSQQEPTCSIADPVMSADSSLDTADEILTLSVFAKPSSHFASYDLLQAISATGMQFGEMNIFHYYLSTSEGRKTLFSLASATKPGDFNIDRIGDFSCAGLTLFMDLSSVSEPELAFSKMLTTAEQLAEDLDGDLYAGPRRPFTANILQKYRERISNFRSQKYAISH